jgi:DNA-binding LytR/AlgR family response regulator
MRGVSFLYRVAICDDEEKQRELVKSILITLSIKTNIDFETEIFGSGEQLVSDYERHETPFHILILDIEMGGINGIQTAQKIRGLNNLDEQIIFLTSYPEYMVESFDVMTFQYLIKPIAPSILEEKMIKICQYFQALDKKYMVTINLLHVKKFTSGVVFMSNGMELPIGRSKIKEVKDVYTKFMIMKVD